MQKYFFIVLVGLIVASCSKKDKKQNMPDLDTPDKGSIRVAVEESYLPLLRRELVIFHERNPNAHITPLYLPESQGLDSLFDKKVAGIIMPRKLKEDELQVFKQIGFVPQVTPIAFDALVAIVNPDNPIDELTVEQLKNLLIGKSEHWNDIKNTGSADKVIPIFDNKGSSIVRYAIDSICQGQPFRAEASAAKSNADVIKYVSENKAAIGLIGMNWLSDSDNPEVREFRRKVKIVGISRKEGGEFIRPYQQEIAERKYPFVRVVYLINAQVYDGLMHGLSAHLYSESGQKIVLKEGLFPVKPPTREVELVPFKIK